MREGKNWHIDDADSVTALVLEEGIEVLPVPVTGYSDFTEDLCSSCFRRFRS